MEAKTEVVTKDRIAELANKPGNTVYAYTYDTPVERMAPEEQAVVIRQIVLAFDAGTVAFPEATDEALRERVLSFGPRIRAFQMLHPRTFAEITTRVHTAEAVEALDKKRKMAGYMILERACGGGTEEEQAGRVMTKGLQMSLKDSVVGGAGGGSAAASPATDGSPAAAGSTTTATTTVDLGAQMDAMALRRACEAIEAAKKIDMGECSVRQPFTLRNDKAV
jgi:hypothetical protein